MFSFYLLMQIAHSSKVHFIICVICVLHHKMEV